MKLRHFFWITRYIYICRYIFVYLYMEPLYIYTATEYIYIYIQWRSHLILYNFIGFDCLTFTFFGIFAFWRRECRKLNPEIQFETESWNLWDKSKMESTNYSACVSSSVIRLHFYNMFIVHAYSFSDLNNPHSL